MAKVRTGNQRRICQGDIYRDVVFNEYAVEKRGEIEISQIIFPLVVVLTQDCDLEQDYKVRYSRPSAKTEDKRLFSVIVAPMYNAEHVYRGEHLAALGMNMMEISKTKTHGKTLRNNETPRFHYLEFPAEVPVVDSIIDFKHYFTVNVEYLKRIKRDHFVCRLGPLYREDLSHRFACFLSRIGLPE